MKTIQMPGAERWEGSFSGKRAQSARGLPQNEVPGIRGFLIRSRYFLPETVGATAAPSPPSTRQGPGLR